MTDMATNLIGATVRLTDQAADHRGQRQGVAPGELARIRAVWVNRDENLKWLQYVLETADGRLVEFPDGPARGAAPYFTIHPARNEPGPQPPDPGDDWRLLR